MSEVTTKVEKDVHIDIDLNRPVCDNRQFVRHFLYSGEDMNSIKLILTSD